MSRSRIAGLLASMFLSTVVIAAPTHAFPGEDGKIAFSRNNLNGSSGIYTVDPDGTNVSQLTNPSAFDVNPAWSPDGSKIAFQRVHPATNLNEIWTMYADGSGQTLITRGLDPQWSPDGTKLVYRRQGGGSDGGGVFVNDGASEVQVAGPGLDDPQWSPDGNTIAMSSRDKFVSSDIFKVNADGTGFTRLTNTGDSAEPSWSPDGSKIAFNKGLGTPFQVWEMNPDGTGQVQLTSGSDDFEYPAWSPSGTRIAVQFRANGGSTDQIAVMNADGTGVTTITGGEDSTPDWGVPNATYVRPKGATPNYVSLVPAYNKCTSPNTVHGAPSLFGSCTPPSQASSQLTTGTSDANGQAANMLTQVKYVVMPGDLAITATITDVRKKSDLSDYTGELSLAPGLRITDKNNTPGPNSATVEDTTLPVTIPCAATTDTTIGSSCSLSTTVNSVYPGAVVAGKRAIWQLGQVGVYDGGTDGLASTTSDNTLFLDQGVFVP
jgi:Tol biopolymer transport system component